MNPLYLVEMNSLSQRMLTIFHLMGKPLLIETWEMLMVFLLQRLLTKASLIERRTRIYVPSCWAGLYSSAVRSTELFGLETTNLTHLLLLSQYKCACLWEYQVSHSVGQMSEASLGGRLLRCYQSGTCMQRSNPSSELMLMKVFNIRNACLGIRGSTSI